MDIKFDPKKLAKLNNPERLKSQDPDKYWTRLNLPKDPVIVDVGCGTGFFSVEFLKRAEGENARVYGLDIAPVMLDWTAENRPEVREGRLILKQMPEAELPLEDDLADLVVMINLHHELHHPHRLLAECRRVLKPGGQVLVIDWKPEDMPQGPPLKIRVQPGMVLEQLDETGFTRTRTEPYFEQFFAALGTKPEA